MRIESRPRAARRAERRHRMDQGFPHSWFYPPPVPDQARAFRRLPSDGPTILVVGRTRDVATTRSSADRRTVFLSSGTSCCHGGDSGPVARSCPGRCDGGNEVSKVGAGRDWWFSVDRTWHRGAPPPGWWRSNDRRWHPPEDTPGGGTAVPAQAASPTVEFEGGPGDAGGVRVGLYRVIERLNERRARRSRDRRSTAVWPGQIR